MRPNKNSTDESRSDKPGAKAHEDKDPCQRGLSMLARMIAEAYLEEIDQRRLMEMVARPLYIEKIQIALDCVDLNNTKARQRLHTLLDEAIEIAEFEGLAENSPPLVLKKDGLSIWLKG